MSYKKRVDLLEKAYPVLKRDGEFLFHYGKSLVKSNNLEEGISVLEESRKYYGSSFLELELGSAYEQIGDFEVAERYYYSSSNMVPSQFYPIFCLIKLYIKKKDYNKACEKSEELMSKEIKISSIAIENMKSEICLILNRLESCSCSQFKTQNLKSH